MASFGRKMRSARLSRRIKLRSLARDLGVSHSYLSACELGHKVPSDKILTAWCEAIGLSLVNGLDWRGTLTNNAKAWAKKRARFVNRLAVLDPSSERLERIAEDAE